MPPEGKSFTVGSTPPNSRGLRVVDRLQGERQEETTVAEKGGNIGVDEEQYGGCTQGGMAGNPGKGRGRRRQGIVQGY